MFSELFVCRFPDFPRSVLSWFEWIGIFWLSIYDWKIFIDVFKSYFYKDKTVLLWLTEVLMKLSECIADQQLSPWATAGSCPTGPLPLSAVRAMPSWDGAAGDNKSVSQHMQHAGFRFVCKNGFWIRLPRTTDEDRANAKGREDLRSTEL